MEIDYIERLTGRSRVERERYVNERISKLEEEIKDYEETTGLGFLWDLHDINYPLKFLAIESVNFVSNDKELKRIFREISFYDDNIKAIRIVLERLLDREDISELTKKISRDYLVGINRKLEKSPIIKFNDNLLDL